MKKTIAILILFLTMTVNVHAKCPIPQPYCPNVVGDINQIGDYNLTGDFTIGGTASDEIRPSLKIIGDADSDGTVTSETLTWTLIGASTPTEAVWQFSSSQIGDSPGGYGFDAAIKLTADENQYPIGGMSRNTVDGLVVGGLGGSSSSLTFVDGGGVILWHMDSSGVVNERLTIVDINGAGILSRKQGDTGDVFTINNTNDTMVMGHTTMDDIQPSISIISDADSDAGGDTDDTFKIQLTDNADPTKAVYDYTSTQSAGHRFDTQVYSNGTVACGDGANTCAYTAGQYAHYVTLDDDADGNDVMTITDGAVAGQETYIELVSLGGGAVALEITPSNLVNGTTVTLDVVGESVTLHFNGSSWNIKGCYNSTADGGCADLVT